MLPTSVYCKDPSELIHKEKYYPLAFALTVERLMTGTGTDVVDGGEGVVAVVAGGKRRSEGIGGRARAR